MQYKDIKQFYNEDLECTYFFTQELLENNAVIKHILWRPDNDKYVSEIHFLYYNQEDAFKYDISYSEDISDINMYMVVKEILTIFEEGSFEEFVEAMQTFAGGWITANMQSDEYNKDRTYKAISDEVKDTIDGYKKAI